MKKIREYLEEHGTAIRKFSGLAVSVLTVLALVGCLSYLFTWKQDQSLLAAQEVAESANLAGKAGMSLSALLVGRWFGLGAFAVVFAMIILSVRLLFGKRKFPVVKNIVLSITGAVLLSFFLAFFSFRFGLENVLGGGLGGECGAVAVIWLENMVGGIITFFILCVLLVIWMFFTSRRFSDWFKGDLAISEKKDSPDVEKKPRRTFTFLAKDPEEKEEAETEAEAEAEKLRRTAQGEADAIYAKMEAQARGTFEVLSKQAEGFGRMVNSAEGDAQKAVLMLIADKLPELVKTQVEAVKGIKIDKVTVWDGNSSKDGKSSTAGFISGLMGSVPPLQDLFKMAGLNLPEYLGTPAAENQEHVEDQTTEKK